MAAHLLEAAAGDIDFEPGRYRVRGTDRSDPAGRRRQGVLSAVASADGVALGLEGSGTFDGHIPSYPNGCHVVRGRARSGDRRSRRSTATPSSTTAGAPSTR